MTFTSITSLAQIVQATFCRLVSFPADGRRIDTLSEAKRFAALEGDKAIGCLVNTGTRSPCDHPSHAIDVRRGGNPAPASPRILFHSGFILASGNSVTPGKIPVLTGRKVFLLPSQLSPALTFVETFTGHPPLSC
ncbi:MAG: hypothetical protein HY331_17985 [Chloroflexi bacterium]|nr:hypothetical protein [Chloroflexota bacterium]